MVADTWWRAPIRARRAENQLGRRRQRARDSGTTRPGCSRRRWPHPRPMPAATKATPTPRSPRRRAGRSDVPHALPRARHDGADELRGPGGQDRREVWSPRRTATHRSPRCRRNRACRWSAARSTSTTSAAVSAARRQPGLRAPGGGDRQAVPGRTDQADLVARRGHDDTTSTARCRRRGCAPGSTPRATWSGCTCAWPGRR